VRSVGDVVAAVAAVDEETCYKALKLIEVEYEELPTVFDPFEAMKKGAADYLQKPIDVAQLRQEIEKVFVAAGK